MGNTVSLNGTNYNVPDVGDSWGQDVTNLLIAMVGGLLQKAGGSFTLTADIDFGANFGLKSAYYKSRAATIASAGIIRLANDEEINWRDQADSADKVLKVNTSDRLEFDGDQLPSQAEMDAKLTDPLTTEGDILIRTGGVSTRLAIGATNQVLKVSGGVPVWGAAAGTGDVVGPGSSTDNAIARWNGVGGDTLQDGATGMADGGALDHARTASAGSPTSAGESYIGITDTSSPRTVTLADVDKVAGRTLMIKDESGGAQANNITVSPQSGTIDGESSIVIGKNYGSVLVYSDGSNWFTIARDNVVNLSHYRLSGKDVANVTASETGTGASGSPTITAMADTSDIEVGMVIHNDIGYFPPYAYVISKTASTVTMSENSSFSGTTGFQFAKIGLTESIKSGAGRLYKAEISAIENEARVFARFYDKNSQVAPESDDPIAVVEAAFNSGSPASSNGRQSIEFPDGLAFSSGLRIIVDSSDEDYHGSVYTYGEGAAMVDVYYT